MQRKTAPLPVPPGFSPSFDVQWLNERGRQCRKDFSAFSSLGAFVVDLVGALNRRIAILRAISRHGEVSALYRFCGYLQTAGAVGTKDLAAITQEPLIAYAETKPPRTRRET